MIQRMQLKHTNSIANLLRLKSTSRRIIFWYIVASKSFLILVLEHFFCMFRNLDILGRRKKWDLFWFSNMKRFREKERKKIVNYKEIKKILNFIHSADERC